MGLRSVMILGTVALLFTNWRGAPGGETDEQLLLQRYADFDQRARQVVLRDGFPVLFEPRMVDPAVLERSRHIANDFPVLGVVIKKEARAYSIPKLGLHELVNDTIGKVPIIISW